MMPDAKWLAHAPKPCNFAQSKQRVKTFFSGMQFQHQQESIHGVGAVKTQEIGSLDLNKNLCPFCCCTSAPRVCQLKFRVSVVGPILKSIELLFRVFAVCIIYISVVFLLL